MKDEQLAITITDRTKPYQGFRQVEVIDYREDESGITARRELMTGTRAITVVAHDPDLDVLLMVRQFRLGAHIGTGFGMTAEFVAGMIDPGETPEQSVRRELIEETGVSAKCVLPMCRFLTTPGLSDETIDLYYAQVDASDLPEVAGVAHETEQTFPFTVSLEDALQACDDNAIYNGIVMVGLLRFAREYDALIAKAAAL
ncbi:NUDIX hydrolase [Ahrensia sp. R2A130]|uniref:NUDIX domain-containing protein n=1 Tax=Ahrensia sp. R2A130 TaxID=744979 RepID=UPI0001E0E08D|nr:NUDIX hydrolase [Ahrensia sp. R2A130]EFL89835.1 nucleoside diphosphate pyrophosphatase [Ahrensia sp. R2A130]